jgi:hypothetical protein
MRWAEHVAWIGGETCTGFWWGNLKERDHWGDPGVDGRIIFRWIFRKWYGGMDWIELAQDRDRWRALVNAGNFLTSCKPISFSRRTVPHGLSK